MDSLHSLKSPRAVEGNRREIMGDIVSIALCCNNPDNGMFTGELVAVDVGTEELLRLESVYDPPSGANLSYSFRITERNKGWGCDRVEGIMSIAERPFPIIGYKQSWGNWCWDCVIVTPETAIEIINHLKSLGCFSCHVGDSNFFETFNEEGLSFNESHLPDLCKWGYQAP